MTRLPDWPARLEVLLAERRAMAFAWGGNDCCLWAADAVLALTGHDPAAAWRGRYRSAAGAARLCRRLHGLAGIGALAGPAIAPAFAQPGDVGLLQDEQGTQLLGVCLGEVWAVVTTRGLGLLGAGAVIAAWGVGRA